MESRNFLRYLFIFLIGSVVLLFTWAFHPFSPPPPTSADLLFSSNRFLNPNPHITLPKPTRRHDHAYDLPRHPLDPLTVSEINTARTAVKSHPLFRSSSSLAFHSIVLEEPDKSLVLKWTKGDPIPRRKAQVVARANGNSHVLTVDLASSHVSEPSVAPVSGYPTLTIEDMTSSTWAPLADARFNRTILDRGVDLRDLACLPISLGWFGKEEENRRLIKVQCYSMEGTANFYMRPIEGLTVLLDMDTKEVVEISDRGKNIPIPKAANTDYRVSGSGNIMDGLINPISIEQPKGPSFIIEDEHLVRWATWEFHLKPDPRAGVVVSQAKVQDTESGLWRDVMYKGFTSELFVPYMDPTDAWYFKTYMDAGEYGFGLQAMPLEPLNDCPRNAHYIDGVFAAGDGTPYVRENMICVFERYAGDIGWRHAESPITGMEVMVFNSEL